MCLILFAYEYSNNYKLVLLSNRDEYHQRPSLQANFWQIDAAIYGGIDKSAGGSWLSVDKQGRLAAITNVRKPPFEADSKQSRGLLIKDFLSQQLPAKDFLEGLKNQDTEYSLFNLLLLDNSGLWYYSNDAHEIQSIGHGIHGLSNASIDTPWPKVSLGCDLLKRTLNSNELKKTDLLNIMRSQDRPLDEQLPHTGVSLEFERLLSPAFIQSDNYGTRCTTLITINYNNLLEFHETSYNPRGQINADITQLIPLSS
jgi:uncharacterized protein with NRDE domain